MTATKKPVLLITGAGGALACAISRLMCESYKVIGIDPRAPSADNPFSGLFLRIAYSHYQVQEVFRKHQPQVVLHLGRSLADRTSANQRFQQNVIGTKNLLEMCSKFKVERVIVLSTFHVYGAHQFNHAYIHEQTPLRAMQTFPELADAVELDYEACNFAWKEKDVPTVVLRPCLVIGRNLNNTMSKILRSPICPTLLGYDPPLQFVHFVDLIRSIELCLEKRDVRGVFNVAGEGVVPFTKALDLAGSLSLPIPFSVAKLAVGLSFDAGVAPIPSHLLDYFRYPAIVSDEAFRETFGYEPSVTTKSALEEFRVDKPSVEQKPES